MTYQDFLVSVEMVVLLLIWWDGRVMKKAALNSEELQRQSLEAQKQYLDLRRKWYESRVKKSKDVKGIHVEARLECCEDITATNGIRSSATSTSEDVVVSNGAAIK